MSEEATRFELLALRQRVALGLRTPANWTQLMRFASVGAGGYIVNLLVFWAVTDPVGAHHRAGAVAAFAVAVTNNFLWNRHWTFRAGDGHAGFQAARFLVVSLTAFAVALTVLEVLVVSGAPELVAQAVAVACAMPLNFLGNRLWSFR